MRHLVSLPLILLLVSCAGCPPKPEPTPAPGVDAGTDAASPPEPTLDSGHTVFQAACSNLAAIGCSEGKSPNCAEVMQHAFSSRLITVRPTCLAAATSKQAARLCGGVTCP